MLVISALALFWYGLVPVAGAFWLRRSWRGFRRRYDGLRLRPFLDYAASRRGGGEYRFIGGFESLSEHGGGRVLWVRNEEITVPVILDKALTYVLPDQSGDPESFDPGRETPQRIRWEQIVSLSGGARVYVGGTLGTADDRLAFVSRRESPLLVIFYDGSDESLTARVIRAGRQGNEYWNVLTPYALALGAFSQLLVMLTYVQRPAFQSALFAALVALGLPLYPLIPPAFLFTVFYRRLWRRARLFRAWRDLARLPLRYLPGPGGRGALPSGEVYGGLRVPGEGAAERIAALGIPLAVPEKAAGKGRGDWYLFGALPEPGGAALPGPPKDPQATWGAVPGSPDLLGRDLTFRAYRLEALSILLLLAGMGLHILFVALVIRIVFRL